jgi:hypothetical protein
MKRPNLAVCGYDRSSFIPKTFFFECANLRALVQDNGPVHAWKLPICKENPCPVCIVFYAFSDVLLH